MNKKFIRKFKFIIDYPFTQRVANFKFIHDPGKFKYHKQFDNYADYDYMKLWIGGVFIGHETMRYCLINGNITQYSFYLVIFGKEYLCLK